LLVRARLDGRDVPPTAIDVALAALLTEADRMASMATTDDPPHAVTTLLSPERLRALHQDLTRQLVREPIA